MIFSLIGCLQKNEVEVPHYMFVIFKVLNEGLGKSDVQAAAAFLQPRGNSNADEKPILTLMK